MKFSEAIRLGAKLGPQVYGMLWDKATQGSCALGAARAAIGFMPWPDEWRWVVDTTIPYWLSDHWAYQTVETVIVHLNDRCHWTREQIADWVEKWEEAHEQELAEQSQIPAAPAEEEKEAELVLV